jgi:hypothetical protein
MRTRPRTFFCRRSFAIVAAARRANGAATFRAINVLSRNLHLTVTRRARLPVSRDEMIK